MKRHVVSLVHFHHGMKYYMPLFGFVMAIAGLSITPLVHHVCRKGEKIRVSNH
jgi:hypothetical protein